MTRGELIRKARKRQKLTQEQLAQRCGIATITIRQYESGKRKPQSDQLVKIAHALNVPVDEIWGDDDGNFLFNKEIQSMIVGNRTAIIIAKDGDIEYLHCSPCKDIDIIGPAQLIIGWLFELNEFGQDEAVKRVQELTRLDEYKQKPITEAPETPSEPLAEDVQGKSSTTQEKPPEGQNNPANGK